MKVRLSADFLSEFTHKNDLNVQNRSFWGLGCVYLRFSSLLPFGKFAQLPTGKTSPLDKCVFQYEAVVTGQWGSSVMGKFETWENWSFTQKFTGLRSSTQSWMSTSKIPIRDLRPNKLSFSLLVTRLFLALGWQNGAGHKTLSRPAYVKQIQTLATQSSCI
jgi:hypothetical protein